ERDESARAGKGDILLAKRAESVKTGRDLEAIAGGAKPRARSLRGRPEGARSGPLPDALRPQLATLVTDAPSGDDWLHEIKFDGYRVLCRIDGGSARLFTRSGQDWTEKFPDVARDAEKLPIRRAWLDGEVVALGADGISSFQRLQNALGRG